MNPENLYHNPLERQIVTLRSFKEVVYQLALPIETIRSGDKVLSVGEGLSNFSRTLMAETGAMVIAADAGYSLFSPKDTPEQARAKIEAGGQKVVIGNNLFSSDLDNTLAPPQKEGEEQLSVAANVYELPFDDNSIDQIVSTHLLEHIDFSRALPEMLRVLKTNGEIRFGGEEYSFSQAEEQDAVLLPTDSDWYQGWQKAFDLMKEEQLSVYGVLAQAAASSSRRTVLLSFVIQKKGNNRIPKFSLPARQIKNNLHGKIVRLNIPETKLRKDAKSRCPVEIIYS